MRRRIAPLLMSLSVIALASGGARADHVPTNIPGPGLPAAPPILQHGDISWVANARAGNGVAAPLGETLPFERDGRRYLVASDSIYGLSVVDVTDARAPRPISTYASSSGCPTADAEYVASEIPRIAGNPRSVFGVAVEAGLGTVGWENDLSVTPDGRIAVIGMDAPGRCHDPEYGGLEFVDLTDPARPRTLHLVRNVGFAHSVGIDPFHPWLAYVATSDSDDFIDVVDFRSCLGGVAEIDACAPEVARIPFTARAYPQLKDPKDAKSDIVPEGCHDLRFTATRAYCAAIDATLIIDTTRITDGDGSSAETAGDLTGTLLTSGPNACPRISATRAPGVEVTDCSGWTEAAFEERLAQGANAEILSVILHDGSKPATQDIYISHQAEPIEGGKILAITDERGGGLNRGTPACPGGGVWFYDIRDERNPKLMKTPDGKPAVFITQHTVPSVFSCTSHYGEQFGNEPYLTFAWYTGGTHVLKITPNYAVSPATIALEEIAAITPIGSVAIQAKPIMRDPADPDRILVYTADAARGLDVFSVAAPRVSAAGEAKAGARPGRGTQVLGARSGRLPKTGVGDPAMGLGLLGVAGALAGWVRRRRI